MIPKYLAVAEAGPFTLYREEFSSPLISRYELRKGMKIIDMGHVDNQGIAFAAHTIHAQSSEDFREQVMAICWAHDMLTAIMRAEAHGS